MSVAMIRAVHNVSNAHFSADFVLEFARKIWQNVSKVFSNQTRGGTHVLPPLPEVFSTVLMTPTATV